MVHAGQVPSRTTQQWASRREGGERGEGQRRLAENITQRATSAPSDRLLLNRRGGNQVRRIRLSLRAGVADHRAAAPLFRERVLGRDNLADFRRRLLQLSSDEGQGVREYMRVRNGGQ